MSSSRRSPPARRPPRAPRPTARPAQRSDRPAPPRRRQQRSPAPRSDLTARIFVAVPAAVVAIVFVDLGGLPFALMLIAIGCICLHELYGLLYRWRAVTMVGFAALVVMVLAARYGSERDVLEVALAAVPLAFLGALLRGHGGMTVSIAATLFSIYWIGFAFAHA